MSITKIIGMFGLAAVVIGGLTYIALKNRKNKDALQIAEQIYSVLDQHRVLYDIDKHSIDPSADTTPQPATGIEKCIENIAHFVRQNRPINMLLVGFPFKSSNLDKKVIGSLPDMAERKSLEYLQNILNQIKRVYSPGASILIFCDGIFFADFFGVAPTTVDAYEQALKALAVDLPNISIMTSQDMLESEKLASTAALIELIDKYKPSDLDFKNDIKTVPQTALKRFALELDYPQGQALIKKYTLEDIVMRLLARETRLRSYVAKKFPSPDYFRLTVHLSPDVSKKFGIKLSPNSDVTPYHGTLVEEADGAWSIKFKKDINQSQYQLQTKIINGIPCAYFKAVSAVRPDGALLRSFRASKGS